MILFPAVDLFGGRAVRLFKGRYDEMTVYSDDPVSVALDFRACGAEWAHLVDLEGARSGGTPNFDIIEKIKRESGLRCEVGGGVRDMETVERYLGAGLDRVILGTAAVEDASFLESAVGRFGDKIAVGVDIRDGLVAVRGWEKSSGLDAMEFCRRMEDTGVRTLICTDISRDGAMRGANRELYRELGERFSVDVTASGGVSGMEDIRELMALGLYGAIIGKAYYTGAIDLREALEAAK